MVIRSETIKNDPHSIHYFIANGALHEVKKLTRKILVKTDTLINLPTAGRKVPELNNVNIRDLSLYSYPIIF